MPDEHGHLWVISGFEKVLGIKVSIYVCQNCRARFNRHCGGRKKEKS